MSASLSHTASAFSSAPSGLRSPKAVTARRFTRARPGRGLLDIWWERAAARRQLAEMEDHILQDIGLSREAARQEARKPFWVA